MVIHWNIVIMVVVMMMVLMICFVFWFFVAVVLAFVTSATSFPRPPVIINEYYFVRKIMLLPVTFSSTPFLNHSHNSVIPSIPSAPASLLHSMLSFSMSSSSPFQLIFVLTVLVANVYCTPFIFGLLGPDFDL